MNDPFDNFCNLIYSDIIAAKNTADLKKVIACFHNTLDDIYRQALTSAKAKIDCHEGCFYCCHIIVDAFPGEILRIADYVRARFLKDHIEQLIQKTDEARKKIEPMTLQERQATSLACPL